MLSRSSTLSRLYSETESAIPPPERVSGVIHTSRRRAGKFILQMYWELPTRIAGALSVLGFHDAAEQFLWRTYCAYPYDSALGEFLANWIYDHRQGSFPSGTVARGRFLMAVMERSCPARRVTAAYFDNLSRVLAGRPSRAVPGQLILGVGAGRCGSTTLARILQTVEGAVVTHEAPPYMHWPPLPEELGFHLRRFEAFRRYVPLIADCAHWWLNAIDQIFEAGPDCKVIGLIRDLDACVRSWMSVSPSDVNHFVTSHNHIWPPDRWDPFYPHYELPAKAHQNPTRAKRDVIMRYVEDYNRRLKALAERVPGRVLLLRTEELDSAGTRSAIANFLQLPVAATQIRYNVGRDSDSGSPGGLYY